MCVSRTSFNNLIVRDAHNINSFLGATRGSALFISIIPLNFTKLCLQHNIFDNWCGTILVAYTGSELRTESTNLYNDVQRIINTLTRKLVSSMLYLSMYRNIVGNYWCWGGGTATVWNVYAVILGVNENQLYNSRRRDLTRVLLEVQPCYNVQYIFPGMRKKKHTKTLTT